MNNHPVFLRKLWINGNGRDSTGKHAEEEDHIKAAKVGLGGIVASPPAPSNLNYWRARGEIKVGLSHGAVGPAWAA